MWRTALFLFALVCAGQTTQPTLKDVLAWLPDDTETVIGTNGPFPIPNSDARSNDDSGQGELSSTQLELQMHMFALAVEGSRHFRPPASLGGMRYEGCGIAVFSSASALDRDAFLKNAAGSAVRFEEVAGVRIAVFEEPLENDVWTTFVAFPRRNVVLVATNIDYLRVVLARVGGASGPRALPETLPEWKYVNTRAPVWGVRHYQKREPDLDPTSPFSERASANHPDNLAVGLAFWFEPSVRKMATVTYLSGSREGSQILQEFLGAADAKTASPREFQIRLRQPAPGVVEGVVGLAQEETFGRFLFGLVAMLGHAVYV